MNVGTRTSPTKAELNGAKVPKPPGEARPLPTRTRRPGLIAAAALLIVGFALAGALLVSRAGGTTQVLTAARPVPAGQVITAADLTPVAVAGPVRAIAATDLSTVVGQTAAVGIVDGQVLNRDMLTGAAVPAAGQSMVGLALRPGQLPGDGLGVGDRVQAIVVTSASDPAGAAAAESVRVLATGEVFALRPDPASGSDTLVTLVVPASAAGKVATYGAAGEVGLIKVAVPAGVA
jgi:hypothetical protein